MNGNHQTSLTFLHGWGFDALVWEGFINHHFNEAVTHAPDMPVYGKEAMREPVTIETVCQHLLDEIKEPTNLFGWSLGGHAAIEFASRYPEKVIKLILMSCSPCFISKTDWPNGVEENNLLLMQTELRSNKDKTLKRFYGQVAKGTDNEKGNLKFLNELGKTGSVSTESLEQGLSLLLKTDQRKQFQALSCPVFMCFGLEDSLVNLRLCSDCKSLNPAISTCQIANAGHAPFLFKSEEVADWIKQILNERLN